MQRILVGVLLAASLVVPVKAQKVPSEGTATPEQREIFQIERAKIKAMLQGGSVAAEWFDHMEDDRLTYIAPFRGLLTKAQYVAQYKSGEFKVHASDHYDFHVRVYNASTAVVNYLTHNTNEVKGKVHSDTHAVATDVFVKEEGEWKHVVHHVTLVVPE